MADKTEPLYPVNENGKAITANARGNVVAFFLWKKNGGIHVPLALTPAEAFKLAEMLTKAASETK